MTDRLHVDDLGLVSSHWDLGGAAVSGGRSVSGMEQAAFSSGGGLWTAQIAFKPRGRDQIRRWRAYGARLDGGATAFEVPHCEVQSRIRLDGTPSVSLAKHSDGSGFSDGSQYAVVPTVAASFGASAALRATQVQLDFVTAVEIIGGERFTVEHANAGARLYTIHSIVSQSSNSYTVKIRPPLREAVTSATPLDFDDLRCTMRLVDGWSAEMQLLRFPDPVARFIEHIDPQAAA
jgi:hypothetical protein